MWKGVRPDMGARVLQACKPTTIEVDSFNGRFSFAPILGRCRTDQVSCARLPPDSPMVDRPIITLLMSRVCRLSNLAHALCIIYASVLHVCLLFNSLLVYPLTRALE